MLLDSSGARVWWDYQIQTFGGDHGETRVGLHTGDIVTVPALEQALGVSLSTETVVALMEAFAAVPYVAPSRRITTLALKRRLTGNERKAIRELARIDADVEDYMDLLDSGEFVDLGDPDVRAGLEVMEAGGVLASGRAAAVLDAPITPVEAHDGRNH